jgi:PAS domain S-box-containing protein
MMSAGSRGNDAIRLLCFPHVDDVFGAWADRLLLDMGDGAVDPARFEEALRATFPAAVVRPREPIASLGAEHVWYVYRDGRYSPYADDPWWERADAMWLEIAPDGRYVDVSDSFLASTGYDRDQVLAMQTGDLTDRAFRTVVPWIWEILETSGVLHSTSVLVDAVGHRVPVEYRLVRLAHGGARSHMREVPLEVARPSPAVLSGRHAGDAVRAPGEPAER